MEALGVGGRNIAAEGGNIFDHFEINYIYPDGRRAFLANRQIVLMTGNQDATIHVWQTDSDAQMHMRAMGRPG